VTNDHGLMECGGHAAALLRAAMPRVGRRAAWPLLQGCSGGMAAALRCRQSVTFSRADLLPYIRALPPLHCS